MTQCITISVQLSNCANSQSNLNKSEFMDYCMFPSPIDRIYNDNITVYQCVNYCHLNEAKPVLMLCKHAFFCPLFQAIGEINQRRKTSSYNHCFTNNKKPMMIHLYKRNVIFTLLSFHSDTQNHPQKTTLQSVLSSQNQFSSYQDQLLSDITLICES